MSLQSAVDDLRLEIADLTQEFQACDVPLPYVNGYHVRAGESVLYVTFPVPEGFSIAQTYTQTCGPDHYVDAVNTILMKIHRDLEVLRAIQVETKKKAGPSVQDLEVRLPVHPVRPSDEPIKFTCTEDLLACFLQQSYAEGTIWTAVLAHAGEGHFQLVGIEPNPGPLSKEMVHTALAKIGLPKDFGRPGSFRDLRPILRDGCGSRSLQPHWRHVDNKNQFAPKPVLVGIEPNPGPATDVLVADPDQDKIPQKPFIAEEEEIELTFVGPPIDLIVQDCDLDLVPCSHCETLMIVLTQKDGIPLRYHLCNFTFHGQPREAWYCPSGADEAEAAAHNAEMHAANGNIRGKPGPKPLTKVARKALNQAVDGRVNAAIKQKLARVSANAKKYRGPSDRGILNRKIKNGNISQSLRQEFQRSKVHGGTMQDGKMMRSIAYAESILKRQGFTDKEVDFIIQMVDPFHDLDRATGRAPSRHPGLSVVRKVVSEVQIQRPAGTTGQWAFYVTNVPLVTNTQSVVDTAHCVFQDEKPTPFDTAEFSGANASGFVPLAKNIWPEGVVVRTASVQNYPVPSFFASQNAVSGYDEQIIIPTFGPISTVQGNNPAYGEHRIVGQGYELTNTSNFTAMQGTIGVCKQPMVMNQQHFTNSGPTPDRPVLAYSLRTPPDITTMKNNVTYDSWAAEEGAYVVNTVAGDDLESKSVGSDLIVLDSISAPNSQGATRYVAYPTVKNVGTYSYLGQVQPLMALHEWNYHPIYAFGLDQNAVFTLKVHTYIEQFPDATTGTSMYQSAQPTARWNPRVWAIIEKMMNNKPAGVILSENPLGEWFWSCIDSLAKYGDDLGTIASASGTPGGTFVGAGLKIGAKSAMLAQGARRLYQTFQSRSK